MKKVSLGITALAILAFQSAYVRAAIVVESAGVGVGAWDDQSYVTFQDIGLGSGGGTANATGNGGSIDVSFITNAQAVEGVDAVNPVEYAPPHLSGSNEVHFDQGAGFSGANPDGNVYLTSGSTGSPGNSTAEVRLVLDGDYTYFGLLWGSVDSYNTLTFYNDGTEVASLNGTQVFQPAVGNQGAAGTAYVNFVATGGTVFDEVVATSSQFAFEFDNVAFGQVPEASTIAVWSLLSLIGLVGYFKKRNAA